MDNTLQYADTPTLMPSEWWVSKSDSERTVLIEEFIDSNAQFSELLEVVIAKADGQVIIHLNKSLTAGERGTILLDFEDMIKHKIDIGLVVWGESLNDKNALRKLRGVEVKS